MSYSLFFPTQHSYCKGEVHQRNLPSSQGQIRLRHSADRERAAPVERCWPQDGVPLHVLRLGRMRGHWRGHTRAQDCWQAGVDTAPLQNARGY